MFIKKSKYLNFSLIFCSIPLFLSAQNMSELNFPSLGLYDQDKLFILPEKFVIETEVDPEAYILGPGDKIGVSIITGINTAYILTITPTGELWIPDIGPIHISGNNSPDAESKVAKYIHENIFKTSDISLVLLNIRQFKIQVEGSKHHQSY